MQPAFLSLILTALHVSVLVDCRPWLQDAQHPPQKQHSRLHTGARADSHGTGRSHSERRGSIKRDFLVVLPVRTESSNFVSIFDLRKKRFLCMDIKGQLYISRLQDREECLFQRIWLDMMNQRDVFYSTSGGLLLKLEGDELRPAHQEPPELSSPLLERLLAPLVKRRRRSEEVNPSDPLRTHSHPSHSAKDHKDAARGQPEQDRAGAVSKETITSCDDPLRVLQPNGPISPLKTNIAERPEQE